MTTSNFNANTFVTVLDNGLTVVTAYKPMNVVQVTVGVNVGGRFESEHETGISHFLEHMAFKGTKTRSAKGIVQHLEVEGSKINAQTGKTTTSYYVLSLPENIEPSLDILADVLLNSVFDEQAIAMEKKIIAEEIRMDADDIDNVAQEAMMAIAYPNQAVGRGLLGTVDDIEKITRDMLVEYIDRHYTASSMVVAAVGNINHDEFVAAVQARFGDLKSGERKIAAEGRYVGGEKKMLDDSYEQATIMIAFPIPGSASPDFARFDLLSDVLGTGMSSPLFQEVRERDGLCYDVSCGTYTQPEQSLFVVHGAANPKSVEAFVRAAMTEVTKVVSNGISEIDWKRARNSAKMQQALYADSQQATSSLIIRDIFAHGRVRGSDEIMAEYEAVTKDDVIRAAIDMLCEQVTVVVAGNGPNIDYRNLIWDAIYKNMPVSTAA